MSKHILPKFQKQQTTTTTLTRKAVWKAVCAPSLCCNDCIRGRISDVINSRVYWDTFIRSNLSVIHDVSMKKRLFYFKNCHTCVHHLNLSMCIPIYGIVAIKGKEKQMFGFIANSEAVATIDIVERNYNQTWRKQTNCFRCVHTVQQISCICMCIFLFQIYL